MPPLSEFLRRRRWAAVATTALAGVAAVVIVGMAAAKSFTLTVARNGVVTSRSGTTHESIVVNGRGHAVYWLGGDSSRHPECTKAKCWSFWPPVTVTSAHAASKAAAVNGRLGIWKHAGIVQVTLSGHPLYTFSEDTKRAAANGDGVVAFGGTWHVVTAAGTATGTGTPSSPTTTSTTTTSTTTPYPGY